MIELKGKYCTDAKVFADDVEEPCMEMIKDVLDSPAFNGAKIRIMPDTHTGKDIVIGFTCPLTEYVNPNHVGVDIGCTVDVTFSDAPVTEIDPVRLESEIRKYGKFGRELNERRRADVKDFCRHVQAYLDRCRSSWPEMIKPVKFTEQYVKDMCYRLREDERTFWKSLGTVGGGNHFIELSDCDGRLCWCIHTGSRHFGLKVAKFHTDKTTPKGILKSDEFKRAKEELTERYMLEGRHAELSEALKTLKAEFKTRNPEGYLSGEGMSEYLTDMAIATAYAEYNHKILSDLILMCVRKQCPSTEVIDYVKSVHNYIDFEDRIIRKGAIRAYEGERCVIPFNMRDGMAICIGKSNPDWNFSAPHGAGRAMSRNQAKKLLSVDDFVKQMEGIVSTSVGAGTIDEAPDAYKPADQIIRLVDDTVEIKKILRPLVNLKERNTVDFFE